MQIPRMVTAASASDRGLPGIQVAIRFFEIDPLKQTRGAKRKEFGGSLVARNKSHSLNTAVLALRNGLRRELV